MYIALVSPERERVMELMELMPIPPNCLRTRIQSFKKNSTNVFPLIDAIETPEMTSYNEDRELSKKLELRR